MYIAPIMPRDRVPSEYIGQARAIFARFFKSHLEATVIEYRVHKELSDRSDRRSHANLRPEHIHSIMQRYRAVGQFGRFHLANDRPGRRSFAVRDCRVSRSNISYDTWDDPEQKEDNITLTIISVEYLLQRDRRLTRHVNDTLAIVSMHALARWYQRAGDTSDSALMTDLATLIEAQHEHYSQYETDPRHIGVNVVVPTAAGEWRGLFDVLTSTTITVDDESSSKSELVLQIRTFV